MAFRKYITLAFALLALTVVLTGCSDDTVAPAGQNEAPVLAPTNVRAEIVNGGDILISWDPSTQLNVRGYNVYRLDRESSSIARVNNFEVDGSSYTDVTAALAHEYEYRVTSISTRDTESGYSAVVITNRTPVPNRRGQSPETRD